MATVATVAVILALFMILVALNAIDAAQTIKALQNGYSEINPVGRWLFKTFGLVGGTIAFKCIILAAVGAAILIAPTAYALAILLPLTGWGIFAVIHNYREMRK